MEIQSERDQQPLVISLAGSLDALSADHPLKAIAARLQGERQQVVLDLGQVDFLSSSGIRVLVEILKQSRGKGGDARLAAAHPGIQRTLEISGLARLVKIYPSVEEAVRSFGSPAPFATLAAFLSNTAAGGVFVIKVKDRSWKTVMTTGIIIPASLTVRALKALQKSMMFTPC